MSIALDAGSLAAAGGIPLRGGALPDSHRANASGSWQEGRGDGPGFRSSGLSETDTGSQVASISHCFGVGRGQDSRALPTDDGASRYSTSTAQKLGERGPRGPRSRPDLKR